MDGTGRSLKRLATVGDSTAAEGHVTAETRICAYSTMPWSTCQYRDTRDWQPHSPRSLAGGLVLGGGQVEVACLIGDRRLRLVVMRADEAGDGRHLHGLGLGEGALSRVAWQCLLGPGHPDATTASQSRRGGARGRGWDGPVEDEEEAAGRREREREKRGGGRVWERRSRFGTSTSARRVVMGRLRRREHRWDGMEWDGTPEKSQTSRRARSF